MKLDRLRLTVIFGVLVLVAVAGLAWMLVLSPRLAEAEEATLRAESLELANVQQLNRYNQLVTSAREVPAAARQAQQLFAKMPQEADLPRVITQITRAAGDAGIPPADIQTLSTSVPVPAEGFSDDPAVALATMQVDISVRGTEAEFEAFLDNLVSLDRSILVQATNLTLVDGGAEGSTMQVTGTMFVLQSPLGDLVREAEQVVADADLPE